MTYTLLADVGGTSTRLARMQDGNTPESPAVYSNRDFTEFTGVLEDFLARQAVLPTQMALAVAGPVHNHSVVMTNLGWTLSAETLEQQFGIPHVAVVNDFAALLGCRHFRRECEDLGTLAQQGPGPIRLNDAHDRADLPGRTASCQPTGKFDAHIGLLIFPIRWAWRSA